MPDDKPKDEADDPRTVMDKQQDAERAKKGTGDATVDPEKGGESHEGPTFTDQGRPV